VPIPKAGNSLPPEGGVKSAQAAFAALRLTHISLALVGLMWVLPFVHYRHQYPLHSFDQEWWSALLGVLALTLLAARDFWQQPEVPRIAQLPAALIAVVLLHLALNKMAYIDQGLLYILYLLFAALLMVLGARLRACFGMEKLAIVLAVFLLIGAELSALIGVLQHFRWHTLLDAVIVPKISRPVYGNLAQSNHFANYVALGLISLGLLLQQQKPKVAHAVLLAAPLLLVMALSGSRSSWLYLLMMSGLAWWWARRDAGLRPLLRYTLWLMVGFGLMHLIVQLPFMAGAEGSVTAGERLFHDNASGSVRLYLWHEAWLMFTQSPWLGVGFGQFAWHHFQLLPVLHPDTPALSNRFNNAHNLVFQLAAEAGIAGLLVLFAALGVWVYGLRRAAPSAARWWGYAALGVLAIHSLLEYPLWHTYFVAVAAILLGALDETRYRLELRNAGRMSVMAILLLGLLSLLQLRSGYQQLKDTLAIRPVSGNYAEAVQRTLDGLDAVHGVSLLSPYAEVFLSQYAVVNADDLEEKLAFNTRVMRFIPIAQTVYRQAFFLAQSGQLDRAKQVLEQAIWSYPGNADARRQLAALAEKDPGHFSALLEFASQKEREYALAVRRQ
jgi:O-antigen ligase